MEEVKTEMTAFSLKSGWINKRCKFCKVLPPLGGYQRIYCTNPVVVEKVYDSSMLKCCLKYMFKKYGDCAVVDYSNIDLHKAGRHKKKCKQISEQIHFEDFPLDIRLQIVTDYINGASMKELKGKYGCSNFVIMESKKFIFNLLRIQNDHIKNIRKKQKAIVLQQLKRIKY